MAYNGADRRSLWALETLAVSWRTNLVQTESPARPDACASNSVKPEERTQRSEYEPQRLFRVMRLLAGSHFFLALLCSSAFLFPFALSIIIVRKVYFKNQQSTTFILIHQRCQTIYPLAYLSGLKLLPVLLLSDTTVLFSSRFLLLFPALCLFSIFSFIKSSFNKLPVLVLSYIFLLSLISGFIPSQPYFLSS